ncbi:MAG: antitoxin VapB family protein [Candidatus Hodarchaeales archaeon]|jgi:predicted CopG family antitoxin
MASKTITVKEEAYLALKSLQLEGESFSDTIIRISNSFGNLKDFWGSGTKSSKEYETELAEIEQRRLNFFQGRQ